MKWPVNNPEIVIYLLKICHEYIIIKILLNYKFEGQSIKYYNNPARILNIKYVYSAYIVYIFAEILFPK
jgi:hypothetical protein